MDQVGQVAPDGLRTHIWAKLLTFPVGDTLVLGQIGEGHLLAIVEPHVGPAARHIGRC